MVVVITIFLYANASSNYFPILRGGPISCELFLRTSLKCTINGIKIVKRPPSRHLTKVNNRNTRARCEICSKLTIKIPERRQWHVISGWEL